MHYLVSWKRCVIEKTRGVLLGLGLGVRVTALVIGCCVLRVLGLADFLLFFLVTLSD